MADIVNDDAVRVVLFPNEALNGRPDVTDVVSRLSRCCLPKGVAGHV